MAFISQIKAGDFNIRLQLQSPTINTNDFGEKVKSSYSTETTVWELKKLLL